MNESFSHDKGAKIEINDVVFSNAVTFDFGVVGDATGSSVYAAIYDESMKLIDVKKLPNQSAGGYSIPNGTEAKYLKVFVIDENLIPKCVQAEATKPVN